MVNEVSSLAGSVDMDSNNNYNDDIDDNSISKNNSISRKRRGNYEKGTFDPLTNTATRLLSDYSFQVGATPIGA